MLSPLTPCRNEKFRNLNSKFVAARLALLALMALIIFQSRPLAAQAIDTGSQTPGEWSHIIVPQSRAFHRPLPRRLGHHQHNSVSIESVKAHVSIVEQAATTTLEVTLRNNSNRLAEAVVLLPVPESAAISGYMFEGSSSEPTAELLSREEARKIYDAIVNEIRDPALLEFAGYNLIRSSVFPLQPNGTQKFRVTYETILEAADNRIDYILPRSESLDARVPWDVTVSIRAKSPISMVYSPSHDLEEHSREARSVQVRIAEKSQLDPGAFRLSYLLERDGGISASMFAYPDPKVGNGDGGYFLLMAGVPAKISDADRIIKREVTLVLDRSGSMAGGKLDQVKQATLQIIEGLEPGESFNIIDYSNKAALFRKRPVLKDETTVAAAREYLKTLRPNGGTNIHDALLEALRQEPTEDTLGIVLFLTDGLPTVGRTNEVVIREMVEQGNAHERRVFTFGVGNDVNVPLLDRLAEITRAKSTFVLPSENVEVKVAQTFRALYGPVLSDIELTTHEVIGHLSAADLTIESTTMIRELIPAELPDVFEGDQVILFGQYLKSQPITFQLAGNFLGKDRSFEFEFDFNTASTNHAFVPRLWATRRIAFLVDEIRQAGADTAMQLGNQATILQDPKYRELIDEIVRLSTEFGVLSEYTSFLAREGTDLSDWNGLVAACGFELDEKAIKTRAGLGAVTQSFNVAQLKAQVKLQYDNRYWSETMEQVEITNVQQVADRAFFKRGKNWVDARLVNQQDDSLSPSRTIDFGSKEHLDMVYAFAADNRQACLALPGDILLEYGGEVVLIKNEQAIGNEE